MNNLGVYATNVDTTPSENVCLSLTGTTSKDFAASSGSHTVPQFAQMDLSFSRLPAPSLFVGRGRGPSGGPFDP